MIINSLPQNLFSKIVQGFCCLPMQIKIVSKCVKLVPKHVFTGAGFKCPPYWCPFKMPLMVGLRTFLLWSIQMNECICQLESPASVVICITIFFKFAIIAFSISQEREFFHEVLVHNSKLLHLIESFGGSFQSFRNWTNIQMFNITILQ